MSINGLESVPSEHMLRLTKCKDSKKDSVIMQPHGRYEKSAHIGC